MVSGSSGDGSKTEEQRQANIRRSSQLTDPYNNPCVKEHTQSYNCLVKNAYQHDKCQLQFENYKACKAFWNHVRHERRRNGIYPYLPDPEDRENIRAEYFAKHKM